MTPEEAKIWYRQKTIDDAVALNVPDGIYTIVLHNSQFSRPGEQIDLFEIFSSTPRDTVEDWISRSRILISSNYEVGDALVGKYANYDALRENFIRSNPGFSEDTYSHAIHLGACQAVF